MDWLEILIPIIFVAIWILSAIFGRNQEEDEPRRPRGRPHPEAEEEVPGEVRRLQDEIRRKIQERQSGESEASRPERTPAPVASRRAQPPRPQPASLSGAGDPVQRGMIHYEEELAKRMKELKATQDRVSQVRREHGFPAPGKRRKRSASAPTPLRASALREILYDPQGARKAFLYLEILGQPVGMRERGAIRPPWES